MEARFTAVTLGVSDIARSVAFYEGLGLKAHTVMEDVAFIDMNGAVLCLYTDLAKDAGVVSQRREIGLFAEDDERLGAAVRDGGEQRRLDLPLPAARRAGRRNCARSAPTSPSSTSAATSARGWPVRSARTPTWTPSSSPPPASNGSASRTPSPTSWTPSCRPPPRAPWPSSAARTPPTSSPPSPNSTTPTPASPSRPSGPSSPSWAPAAPPRSALCASGAARASACRSRC